MIVMSTKLVGNTDDSPHYKGNALDGTYAYILKWTKKNNSFKWKNVSIISHKHIEYAPTIILSPSL